MQMNIEQIGAAEHCGREAGQAYAFRLNAAVGVFDPLGLARVEAKNGMRLQGTLADKLSFERGFIEQFKRIFRVHFDYTNQAWIVNGVYERCGHPEDMDCRCFGKLHAGEPAQEGAEIA